MQNEQNVKRVLLVEDDALALMGARMALEDAGFSMVDTSKTGEEAVQLTQKNHYDLILMDIGLAGKMNGYEAIECILANQQQPNALIYVLTAQETGVKDNLGNKKVDVIQKPFSVEKCQEIGELLASTKSRTPGSSG